MPAAPPTPRDTPLPLPAGGFAGPSADADADTDADADGDGNGDGDGDREALGVIGDAEGGGKVEGVSSELNEAVPAVEKVLLGEGDGAGDASGVEEGERET